MTQQLKVEKFSDDFIQLLHYYCFHYQSIEKHKSFVAVELYFKHQQIF